jgi:hypothetical protein
MFDYIAEELSGIKNQYLQFFFLKYKNFFYFLTETNTNIT